MLFFKSRCNKQAVDPWYTSLISKHAKFIFRNQNFIANPAFLKINIRGNSL